MYSLILLRHACKDTLAITQLRNLGMHIKQCLPCTYFRNRENPPTPWCLCVPHPHHSCQLAASCATRTCATVAGFTATRKGSGATNRAMTNMLAPRSAANATRPSGRRAVANARNAARASTYLAPGCPRHWNESIRGGVTPKAALSNFGDLAHAGGIRFGQIHDFGQCLKSRRARNMQPKKA